MSKTCWTLAKMQICTRWHLLWLLIRRFEIHMYIVFHHYIENYSIYKQDLCFSPCRIYFVRGSWIHACYEFMDRNTNTVKPALVTTSIKRKLVLCDHNFYFPSQCISYQLNLYEVTTCLMWPYFTVTIKQSYIICLISSIALVVHH